MMAAATIRADGIDWPLRTFLDAYGYHQVDRFTHPNVNAGSRVLTIDDVGRIREPLYADAVDWHATFAWRALDPRDAPAPCCLCGTSTDDDDFCDACWEDGERGE
jgi:hypothetical protein